MDVEGLPSEKPGRADLDGADRGQPDQLRSVRPSDQLQQSDRTEEEFLRAMGPVTGRASASLGNGSSVRRPCRDNRRTWPAGDIRLQGGSETRTPPPAMRSRGRLARVPYDLHVEAIDDPSQSRR